MKYFFDFIDLLLALSIRVWVNRLPRPPCDRHFHHTTWVLSHMHTTTTSTRNRILIRMQTPPPTNELV